MDIENSIAFITGANGGIGRAFVDDLLRRGAAKIYFAARSPEALAIVAQGDDPRILPVGLDVTDVAQVAAAAERADDVTLLVNNAGYAGFGGAIEPDDLEAARREMDVNYFGVLSMSRAFAPVLARNGGGAIVNVLSFLSLATLPLAGTYCASKAAALALTRSLRAELAAQGTLVVASMPVQVDTAMGSAMPDPKVSPREAASDTLDAVQASKDEVFPGELSRMAGASFEADPKAVQAQLSMMIPMRSGGSAV